MNNATDTKSKSNGDARQLYIPFNSQDFTAYVKRLPINKSTSKEIYLYGSDNLYPQKSKAIASRSNSLETALKTLSRFTAGQGFEGLNDLVVNEEGLTGPKFFNLIIHEKSQIGFAIHCSYNRLGQVTELTPVNFEFVRKKILSKGDKWPQFRINADWEHRHFMSQDKHLDVFAFDPDEAQNQIKEVGFEKYPGQLFYFHHSNDIYGLSTYDSIQDDAQFESDAKLYGLSNVQNGFAVSGIFKYPISSDTLAKKRGTENKFMNAKGPINAGRFINMPFAHSDTIPTNLWESISLPDVDKMFKEQNDNAKRNIYEKYQQPGIINGRSDAGMFNAQSMQDAFDFYNSLTVYDRGELQTALTPIFEASIFDIPLPIEIKPLEFMPTTQTQNPE